MDAYQSGRSVVEGFKMTQAKCNVAYLYNENRESHFSLDRHN